MEYDPTNIYNPSASDPVEYDPTKSLDEDVEEEEEKYEDANSIFGWMNWWRDWLIKVLKILVGNI